MRLALVGGPMYDQLYGDPGDPSGWLRARFAEIGLDLEVLVHADHPTLNRRVADLLAAGERIDVLATHSKYAPSQAAWLHPLDEVVPASVVDPLAPRSVELCRSPDGMTQLCLPRLVDVRVLWYRTDRVDPDALDTWSAIDAGSAVFGFTGRESGLFGTFFEFVAGEGGRLFDEHHRPLLDQSVTVAAIERLVELGRRVGAEIGAWHYDDVDRALLGGRVDAAAAWPGGWGAIRTSAVADVLAPLPYPAGSQRRVSYSGCHAWAIPITCDDVDASAAALAILLGAEAQTRDARGGSWSAHVAAQASMVPDGEVDRRRRSITAATIDASMITYPSLPWFPAVEDAGWTALRAALLGELTPADAASRMQALALSAAR